MKLIPDWFRNLFMVEPGPDYVDQETLDVIEFNQRFGFLCNPGNPGHLTRRKLAERFVCMQEELDEFRDAVLLQDLPAQADALIDLVYFAKGTAVMLGLPWEELWSDVHAANMAKVPGVTKRGQVRDVTKPADWVPPATHLILRDYGYNRRVFTNEHDQVVEEFCRDDV